jgi:hypothetical protein
MLEKQLYATQGRQCVSARVGASRWTSNLLAPAKSTALVLHWTHTQTISTTFAPTQRLGSCWIAFSPTSHPEAPRGQRHERFWLSSGTCFVLALPCVCRLANSEQAATHVELCKHSQHRASYSSNHPPSSPPCYAAMHASMHQLVCHHAGVQPLHGLGGQRLKWLCVTQASAGSRAMAALRNWT